MMLAMGTNTSPLHYKTLSLFELEQSIEVYMEYVEERNRVSKANRG